jgi:hypothetical protein
MDNKKQGWLLSIFVFALVIVIFPFGLGAEESTGGQSGTEPTPPSDQNVFSDQVQPFYFYSLINRVGFVRRKPVIPLGRIFGIKSDKQMVSKGDEIYLREMNRTSPLVVGRYYTLYRTPDRPITDRKTGAYLGTQYYLTGVVEITEKTPRFAVGRVLQSFRTIKTDDLLMPYTSRSPKIPLTESAEGLEGVMIGSEEGESVLGMDNIIFINKGEKDGVAVGQEYNIYDQEKGKPDPQGDDQIPLSRVTLGAGIILLTEETTSTMLITRSNTIIYPGAKICSP